jgi:hypothetical protein
MPNLRGNPLTISLSSSPPDVPSTSPSDVPSTSPSDVPSTSPSDVPSKNPSDVQLSVSAASSTSNKSGKKIPSSGPYRLNLHRHLSPLPSALCSLPLVPLNPNAQPPHLSIFAMMGSILIPTVLRHLLGPPSSSIFAMMGSILILTILQHLLGLNSRSRSKTKCLNRLPMTSRSDSSWQQSHLTLNSFPSIVLPSRCIWPLAIRTPPPSSIFAMMGSILIPTVLRHLLGPPSSSIFAMMGSILIPTVLRHLLGLNSRSRSKTKTETID